MCGNHAAYRQKGETMSATMALEKSDGTAFQITAGSSDTDGSEQRHLSFGVPETNDTIRLDWAPDADFGAGPVEVRLRIGTMPASAVTVKDHEIVDGTPPDQPRFGPDADGIVSALAHAYATLVVAHPGTVAMLHGRVPKHILFHGPVPKDVLGAAGEVPKDLVGAAEDDGLVGAAEDDGLVGKVAQYATAGAMLGKALAGP